MWRNYTTRSSAQCHTRVHTHTHTPVHLFHIEYMNTFIYLHRWVCKCTLNEVKVSVRCSRLNIPAWCSQLRPSASAPWCHCPPGGKKKPFAQSAPYPVCHCCRGFYGDAFLQTKHVEGTPPAEGGGITLWRGNHTPRLIYISKHEPWTVAYCVCSLNISQ